MQRTGRRRLRGSERVRVNAREKERLRDKESGRLRRRQGDKGIEDKSKKQALD